MSANSAHEGIKVSSYLIRKQDLGGSDVLAFVADLSHGQRRNLNDLLETTEWRVQGVTTYHPTKYDSTDDLLSALRADDDHDASEIDQLANALSHV